MNEVRDYARECGVRCRQIRMAKGMSQQQLAEKMSVTSAAVSKWEKEGISNIDHIKRISDVLGQDITADQLEQEGAIGEVGKEILRDLVMFDGYLDVDSLYSSLYGMKKDRICNELFKLERIGTVVREQFTDFSGEERDGLFITAKGLIAYKNHEMTIDNDLNCVKTLDSLLINDATSIQDVIDADVTTDFILNKMDLTSAYRLDYLTYLHDTHMNLIVPTNKMGELNDFWWNAKEAFLCGESCYVDILRRMAQSASRKEMDATLKEILENGLMGDRHYDKLYEAKLEATGVDDVAEEALEYFSKICGCFKETSISEEDKAFIAEEHKQMENVRKIEHENIATVWKFEGREFTFYRALSPRQKANVNLWFSYDEIRKFIEENILPPSTEYERFVDRKLREIWKYDKTTLNYYYNFTELWEKNGLAQLIRDRIGVPQIEV